MPSTDTDLSLSLFSVCAGVFGDGGGQEYMPPPTPVAPHFRGRPPGDTGYGMYPAQCVHVCVCVPTQVCVHSLEVHGVVCVSLFIIDVPPTSTLLRSQVNFLNLLKLLCVHLRNH